MKYLPHDKIDFIKSRIPEEHFKLIDKDEIDNLYNYLIKQETENKVSDSKDYQFMRLAREISTWSKDPSSQLGAVAISENNFIVLAQGYNGFPRGIKDDHRLYIRALKYPIIVHAEMNLIYNAARNGTSLENSTVYVYGLPCCSDCVRGIIQSKVKRIVMCDIKKDPRWIESFKLTSALLDEAGIEYKFIEQEYLD